MAKPNHSTPRILCSILVALLPAIITSPCWAQAPAASGAPTTRLVPVSGVLSDGRGQPISGTVAVTFELFDSQIDGTLLWTETQQVEADARGRYTVYLGAAAGVPQEAFSSEQPTGSKFVETNRRKRKPRNASSSAIGTVMTAPSTLNRSQFSPCQEPD